MSQSATVVALPVLERFFLTGLRCTLLCHPQLHIAIQLREFASVRVTSYRTDGAVDG
jgi:hypothetical protein